ncbi:MAG: benzoyl-CoA 2,3-epoxidase subunit BoxB, partial [Methylobacteriaceae bacterium]|nr:benzoyl-CoA 2,3-epoxidase subunit BoxB [Methylobacteriaceae bacterium]
EDAQAIDKVRALGVVDLPTIQKKINLHYSLSLDLFGSEVSTNAANFYNAGLKGRFRETRIEDDHRLTSSTYQVAKLVEGRIALVEEPALTALNMRLRDNYTQDCAKGIERWNKIIEKTGVGFRLQLPHTAFHRKIGEFKDICATPDGEIIDAATFEGTRDAYLPSAGDGAFIESLMRPQTTPGQFAGWIAPPKVGIDNRPGDFEYVKIDA